MFFPHYTKRPCVQPRLTSGIKIVTYFTMPQYKLTVYRLLPTSCRAVSPNISHIDIKGFHVVSFNCKRHSVYTVHLWQRQNILQIQRAASCAVQFTAYYKKSCSVPPAPERRFDRKPARDIIFLVSLFLDVYVSSLLLPQLPCVSPYRRPLALTACCAACLSLFYQPLFALYGCSSCI